VFFVVQSFAAEDPEKAFNTTSTKNTKDKEQDSLFLRVLRVSIFNLCFLPSCRKLVKTQPSNPSANSASDSIGVSTKLAVLPSLVMPAPRITPDALIAWPIWKRVKMPGSSTTS